MSNPRFEEDTMIWSEPNIDKICCKDCILRKSDIKVGKDVVKGAIKGICEVYEYKPNEILFDGEKCPYYVSENE